jgi:hypothetical protein
MKSYSANNAAYSSGTQKSDDVTSKRALAPSARNESPIISFMKRKSYAFSAYVRELKVNSTDICGSLQLNLYQGYRNVSHTGSYDTSDDEQEIQFQSGHENLLSVGDSFSSRGQSYPYPASSPARVHDKLGTSSATKSSGHLAASRSGSLLGYHAPVSAYSSINQRFSGSPQSSSSTDNENLLDCVLADQDEDNGDNNVIQIESLRIVESHPSKFHHRRHTAP